MRRVIFVLALSLAVCASAFAQSPFAGLDKVKEIKLLESTRDDVWKILANYSFSKSNELGYVESFSVRDSDVEVTYSDGSFSEDSDIWNVSEWKVETIKISFKTPIEIKKSGVDFSKYVKERLYANVPQSFIYHKKDEGIAFIVEKNRIVKIYLFPRKNVNLPLCNNSRSGKFYSNKSWFPDSKLKDRFTSDGDYFNYANVTDLNLSATVLTADCPDNEQTKSCSDEVKKISISTFTNVAENSALTFMYKVSGGKIIGSGAKVVWDLTGVNPGAYTITAGVDDGCGFCGDIKTKNVIVKECPNCSRKENY